MIYLLDEKKNRQEKYGWLDEKFNQYSSEITLVNNFKKLKEISSDVLLSDSSNIILLHDSFFKNLDLTDKSSFDFKERVKKRDIRLVTFGGSFSVTEYSEKSLQIPVSELYQNLEIYIKTDIENLRILAYGINYEIEEWLNIKNIIDNYLFKFDDGYDLNENEIYELQKKTFFNEEIMSMLGGVQNVGTLKSMLIK